MMLIDLMQIAFFLAVVLGCVPLLGSYMAKVYRGERTFLHPLLHPLEHISYKIGGINPNLEMGGKKYLQALLLFNFIGVLTLFLILQLQGILPLNPENFKSLPWSLALSTATSFVTNTNWQAYSGEVCLSYGTQMWGITVQNFLSAATGNAVLLALIRGIVKKNSETLGNFWVDLVRGVVYILLPCAFLLAILLISQGVVQTFSPYLEMSTLENHAQTLPFGPAASQIAIKQIGTNGGGFFGTNSCHPFENPTPLSNFLEMLALVLIPASATYMYGSMTGARKQGWLLLGIMCILWVAALSTALYSEKINNPLFNSQPLLEGKEVRNGIVPSLIWSITTTSTSNGSVNVMLDSLSPLAGGVALFNLLLGGLTFGGVGVGFATMLMFLFLTIFLAGLMVGRTPAYMGKKIEKKEMQWVSVAILLPAVLTLIGGSIASLLPEVLENLGNRGPHGLTEIFYAFASTSANNGSAFQGLNANTFFYNLSLTAIMLASRLATVVPCVVIAGSLVVKKAVPDSKAFFSTETLLFTFMLLGVALIVGALIFFPALCLGPIIEHFLMLKGAAF